jgi:hypothetical protein
MKKLIIITLGTMLCLAASAQSEPIKKGKREHNNEKRVRIEKAIENKGEKMASKLMLNEETTAKFIPVYTAYLNSLTEGIGKNGEKLQKSENMSDSEIDVAMQKRFANSHRITDVREKYYNEFRKFLTPLQAKTALQMNDRNGKHFGNNTQFNKRSTFRHAPKTQNESAKED